MTRTTFALLTVLLMPIAPAAPARAQEMPNPRQMSGVPLPVGDVAAGTVTVRVLRGSFANPVTSQTVELTGGPSPLQAVTNDAGRAEFTGLKPGTRLRASAVVAGERLESQAFDVPVSGGIRLMLVAADPAAEAGAAQGAPGAAASGAAAPAGVPGQVVFGEESRFIFEFGEDGMSVFYVLQVVNRAGVAVEPAAPLVLDLPANARRATILEGSSPQATVAGTRVQIAGPVSYTHLTLPTTERV